LSEVSRAIGVVNDLANLLSDERQELLRYFQTVVEVGDCFFDLIDPDVLGVADVLLSTPTEVVLVDAAVPLNLKPNEPKLPVLKVTGVTPQQTLEIVVVGALSNVATTAQQHHLLNLLKQCLVNNRFVFPLD
jgi:alkylhydroperoxidase family enzyme